MPPPRGASFEWNYHSIQGSTTLPTYYLLGTVSLPPHAHKCALNDKTTVVSERNRLIMSTYSHSPTSEKAKFWVFMVRSASHAFCSRNEGKCCIMMIARLHPAMISNINYLFIFWGNATAKQQHKCASGGVSKINKSALFLTSIPLHVVWLDLLTINEQNFTFFKVGAVWTCHNQADD